ncbi:MAG: 2-dehydropantoate 2-reductase [Nitrospinae bacterium]|nr:2-dehydropantoate 2-reductase [Nitrospinota bacterium]
MRIVVAGTGGVGAYYGAVLAKAGHEVFFIARGAQLDAISKNGVEVKSINGDFHIAASSGETSAPFGVADLILVCFKAYDTAGTLELYAPSVGPETAIISLQNGVDNEEIIAARFGWEKVLGGLSFIGSRVDRPGEVIHTAASNVIIGEMDGTMTDRVNKIGEAFNAAGVKCKVSAEVKKEMFGKMIWNVGFNALCAVLECPSRAAIEFDETKNIVRAAMLEWTAVARAMGVALTDDMADKHIERTFKAGEIIPSMLQDRRRGKRMEIETFNAKVAQLGEKHGMPTPVNSTLSGIIKFWNRGF